MFCKVAGFPFWPLLDQQLCEGGWRGPKEHMEPGQRPPLGKWGALIMMAGFDVQSELCMLLKTGVAGCWSQKLLVLKTPLFGGQLQAMGAPVASASLGHSCSPGLDGPTGTFLGPKEQVGVQGIKGIFLNTTSST